MSPQEEAKNWYKAESEALQAEAEVRRMGQGASDPRAAELFERASELRKRADSILNSMLDAVRRRGEDQEVEQDL